MSEITSGVSIELLLCLNLLDSSANSIQKRERREYIVKKETIVHVLAPFYHRRTGPGL